MLEFVGWKRVIVQKVVETTIIDVIYDTGLSKDKSFVLKVWKNPRTDRKAPGEFLAVHNHADATRNKHRDERTGVVEVSHVVTPPRLDFTVVGTRVGDNKR
jgi:hypothetical protein